MADPRDYFVGDPSHWLQYFFLFENGNLKIKLHVIFHFGNVLIVKDIYLKMAFPMALRSKVYYLACCLLCGSEPLRQAGSPLTGVLPDLCILFFFYLETSNRGHLSRFWAVQQQQKKNVRSSLILTLSAKSR
jgi:hypothetical protein